MPDILKSTVGCTFPLTFELELDFRNGTVLSLSLSRRADNNQANKSLFVIRNQIDGTHFVQKQQLGNIQVCINKYEGHRYVDNKTLLKRG